MAKEFGVILFFKRNSRRLSRLERAQCEPFVCHSVLQKRIEFVSEVAFPGP